MGCGMAENDGSALTAEREEDRGGRGRAADHDARFGEQLEQELHGPTGHGIPPETLKGFFCSRKIGAGDGIRTHDPNLGKVVLYP
jgi:hypothetical protein